MVEDQSVQRLQSLRPDRTQHFEQQHAIVQSDVQSQLRRKARMHNVKYPTSSMHSAWGCAS